MFLQRKKSKMYLKLLVLVISRDYWPSSLPTLYISVSVEFFREKNKARPIQV